MHEPQKWETLRFFFPSLPPIVLGKPAELDQPRLVWMQFQPELGQPFLELRQEPFCLVPVLKSYNKIIGVADSYYISPRYFCPPCFQPQIEYMMQIHIRQQR